MSCLKMHMSFCFLVSLLCCGLVTAITEEDLAVPRGIDLVLSPSTNATWWKMNDKGVRELVSLDDGLARITQNGYLNVTVNSSSQGGVYSQQIYVKPASMERVTAVFPKIILSDVNMNVMDCTQNSIGDPTFKIEPSDKECPSAIEYYISDHDNPEKGVFSCLHDGLKAEVLAKGTDMIFVSSTIATWWLEKHGSKSAPVTVDGNTWVDEHGRLRVRVTSRDQTGQYRLTFFSKLKSNELEWHANPFPYLKLDDESISVNGTIVLQSGETKELECAIHYPRYGDQIIWYQNLAPIDTGWMYTIKNSAVSDSGVYICMKDSIGQAIRVIVAERRILNNTITTITGQSVTLSCELPRKDYKIKWHRDDVSKIIATGRNLTIQNVNKSLAGNYFCYSGNVTQAFSVSVRDNHHDSLKEIDSDVSSTRTWISLATGLVACVLAVGLCLVMIIYRRFRRAKAKKNTDEELILLEVDMKPLGEELRTTYKEKLPLWYKPVLKLSASDGQPLYISPVLRLDKVGDDCLDRHVPRHTDILSVMSSMKQGSRIVLSGDAGHGKSALLNYLCRLWVNRDPSMDRYKLVIYGLLRDVRSTNLTGVLQTDFGILNVEDVDALESQSEETLWLIDSYEELNPAFYKTDIDNLLKGTFHPNVSVVVTTRPHCTVQLCSPEADLGRNTKGINSNTCVLSIQKFSEDNRNDYVDKIDQCLDKTKHSKLEGQLQSMLSDIPSELLSVPLFLALICSLLFEKGHDILSTMINTRTKLMNILLQKSIQDSSQKLISKPTKLPMFHSNPLEPSIDTEIRSSLLKLGASCYNVLADGKRHLDRADLENVVMDITKIGELGIGDLTDVSASGMVTFPHALVQEYLAAVFLISSHRTKEDLLENVKLKMDKPEINLANACGNYWQVVLFAVGLQPTYEPTLMVPEVACDTSSSSGTPVTYAGSFLKQLYLAVINSITCLQEKTPRPYMHIDLCCEGQLYDECSSESDRQEFVSHLASCNILLENRTSPVGYEKPFPLVIKLQIEGIVVTWGEKLRLCKKVSGTMSLCGPQFYISGAVLGTLLEQANSSNVTHIGIKYCNVDLQRVGKIIQHKSELSLVECRVISPAITSQCPYLETFMLNKCENCSFSKLSAFFTQLSTLKVKSMEHFFNDQPENQKVTSLVVSDCDRVDIAGISRCCPSLAILSVKRCKTLRTVESQTLTHLHTLRLHNVRRINAGDLGRLCPALTTLLIDGCKTVTNSQASIAMNLKTLLIKNTTPIPLLSEYCPYINTIIIIIGKLDDNISLANLVKCLHGVPEIPSQGIGCPKAEIVVLYDDSVLYGQKANYGWITDRPADNVRLKNISSYITCKVLSGEETEILHTLFPNAEIKSLVKSDIDKLLHSKGLDGVVWEVQDMLQVTDNKTY